MLGNTTPEESTMPTRLNPRSFSLTPVTAIALVALAAMLVALAGMFFLSRSRLELTKEKIELTPPSASSSSSP
jgi:hypothetical protein